VSPAILVTGATGNVGGELVRTLLAAGEEVRALVRDGQPGALPAGAVPVVGDLDRPETLSAPLAGAQGVFLLSGYRDMPGLLAEARGAGVERVVLLSGSSVEASDTANPISRYMIRSEAAVRASGLPWTILRPSAFMSNTLQWAPQLRAGVIVRAPFAGVRQAVVDPLDIAAVAAEGLRTPRHEGRTYRLTGAESLLPADRVRVLAAVLGRRLRFEAQPDVEAREQMSREMPEEYAEAFFSFYARGTLDEAPVLPTVQEVTGRPARTFEQWARAHASAFG
jgi:uncharacterized protein YbjT (DUF2867 family)